MSVGVALGTKRLRAVQMAVVLLLLIVIYSVVKRFVIDRVIECGGRVCPPTIVGVGVGGTSDLCMHLAKIAATRPLGTTCSEPDPFGIISIDTVSGRSSKSTWMIGTRMPVEVWLFLRVIGCTTEERNGCSRVARSQPRRIAAVMATPSSST